MKSRRSRRYGKSIADGGQLYGMITGNSFQKNSWYDIRDPERSWIFKVDDDEEINVKADE